MTGQELYKLWEDYRVVEKARRPIGKSSLQQYEVVWGSWLLHCAGAGVGWNEAPQEEVQKFIGSITPRSRRGTPVTSALTIKRYWRTLYDLYAFAVLNNVAEENPADLPQKPVTAVVLSLALSPADWQALSDGLPGGFTPKDRRNRLVLLLIMRAALTVGELTNLAVDDIKEVQAGPKTFEEAAELSDTPLFQPESPFWLANEAHPTYSITVDSKVKARCRTLILDDRTSKAVYDWLEYRSLLDKNVTDVAGAKRFLFSKIDGHKPMADKSIYNICQAHFIKCLGTDNKIQHIGPNTLRNTCITVWHSLGTPETELMRRLGLKAAGSFRRLVKHFTPTLTLS
jgi:integrase/recombinase XerC